MDVPKRGRGRPRKIDNANASTSKATDAKSPAPAKSPASRTTRSVTLSSARNLRPRTSLSSTTTPGLQPARKRRGRPPKVSVVDDGRVEKRRPGRPKKSASAATLVAKKISVPVAAPKPGKRRGRPPKIARANDEVIVPARGRPRGRPPKTMPPAVVVSAQMEPSGIAYETWDVFTASQFAGNPLAVVHLPAASALTQAQKQTIAKEFNFSETTFVLKDGKDIVVDIFTPYAELPFAGHPTIGTICSLADNNPKLSKGELSIKAGPVPFVISRATNGKITGSAQIPHDIHVHSAGFADAHYRQLQPKAWAESFGDDASPSDPWPMVSITKGMTFALLEVSTMDALGQITKINANLQDLIQLDEEYAPSLCGCYFYFVEWRKDGGTKQMIHSRMVESEIGEDPVTGSAASALLAYLAMEFFKSSELREVEFEITQGEHMGRSGTPRIRVEGNAEGKVETMILSGQSTRVMKGLLDV